MSGMQCTRPMKPSSPPLGQDDENAEEQQDKEDEEKATFNEAGEGNIWK